MKLRKKLSMIVHGRVFDMKHHLIAMNADKNELIKNFDKFKNIKNYPGTPKAFTEKGLYMLATILKSQEKIIDIARCQISRQVPCLLRSLRTRAFDKIHNLIAVSADEFLIYSVYYKIHAFKGKDAQ